MTLNAVFRDIAALRILRKLHFAAMIFLLPHSGFADTIYFCKRYDGGSFWSSDLCSRHKAYIDRTASVPSGMPWDQKVQMGEAQRREAAKLVNANVTPITAETRCADLKSERDKIWSRYTNWQYQPPEVVGPDRLRTIAIDAEQQALRCSQR